MGPGVVHEAPIQAPADPAGLAIGPLPHPLVVHGEAKLTVVAWGTGGELAVGAEDGSVWWVIPAADPGGEGRLLPIGAGPGPARALQLTARGELIAGFDGAVRRWTRAGQAPSAPAPRGRLLALDGTGTRTIVGGEQGRVLLGDAPAGQRIVRAAAAAKPTTAAFSADGERLALGTDDGMVEVQTRSGGAVYRARVLPVGSPTALAFSPDGAWLAVGTDQSCQVQVWRSDAPEQRWAEDGHLAPVRSLSWSADGQWLASGSQDASAFLWSMEGQWRRLLGHSGVVAVAFGSDGTLATAATDGEVRQWRAEDRTALRRHLGHTGAIRAVDWDPSGRWLVSGAEDDTLRVWDLVGHTESWRRSFPYGAIWGAAWSPDGARIAVAEDRRSSVVEAHHDSEPRWLDVWTDPQRDATQSVDWRPGGGQIATGSLDGVARVYDLQGGGSPVLLDAHAGPARKVAFSPDGQKLAVGTEDGRIRLWSPETAALDGVLEGHRGSIWAIDWAPAGDRLASGSDDTTVRIWDPQTGAELRRLEGHQGWVRTVAWNPDGEHLATASFDRTVRLWDGADQFETIGGHDGPIRSVAWNPSGTLLASGSADQSVRIWNPANHTLVREFAGQSDWIRAVAWDPTGRTVVSAADNGVVLLWDLTSGAPIATFEGHESYVRAVAFSPDGRWLATGSADGTVRVWDPKNGGEWSTFVAGSPVRAITWSPDSTRLVGTHDDWTFTVWDVEGKIRLRRVPAHLSIVRSAAWSPDGAHLVTAGDDSNVRLWRTADWTEERALRQQQGPIGVVAFTPDGKQIVSGSDAGSVWWWRVADGRALFHVDTGSSVRGLALAPDGSAIALGFDRTIELRAARTGAHLRWLDGHHGPIWGLAFSRDGRLVSGADDRTVRIWGRDLRTEWLLSPGRPGTWYSWQADGRLLWAQDAEDLEVWAGGGEQWRSVTPPPGAGALELEGPSAVSVVDGGPPVSLSFTLRNGGSSGVSAVRLVAIDLPPGVVFSADRWVSRLDPGASVVLTAAVAYLDPVDGQPPTPQSLLVRLEVRTAAPSVRTAELQVRVSAPRPRVSSAVDIGGVIELALRNGGADAYEQPLWVRLQFLDSAGQVAVETDPQRMSSLPAVGRPDPLAFRIPEDAPRPVRVRAVVRGAGWSSHEWPLDARVQRRWGASTVVALALLVGVAGWIQLVVRHPLALRLSGDPAALLALDVRQVPAAHGVLWRAGRLSAALGAAAVPRSRWEALRRAARADPEAIAEILGGRLELLVTQAPRPAAIVALPTMPIRMPLRLEVFVREAAPVQDLVTALRVWSSGGTPPPWRVVIDLSDPQDAAQLLGSDHERLAVVDARSLAAIGMARDPAAALARAVSARAPLKDVSPYTTSGGLDQPWQFYGRAAELDQLSQDRATVLVGARQMGKTSLLKALRRRASGTAHYALLTHGDFERTLALQGISLDDLAAARAEEPAYLLLDEADQFVDEDRQRGFPMLNRLRALTETGRVRVVLAGYWSLYRSATRDHHSPIRNFGRSLTLGPLDRRDATLLATRPLEPLGVRWSDPALVEDLLDQTGCRANLIAIACDTILANLREEERTVRAEHTAAALDVSSGSGKKLAEALSDWRNLTDDPRERATDRMCAYAAVWHDRFTTEDLRHHLSTFGADIPTERLDESAGRFELAHIWRRDQNVRSWAFPLLQRVVIAEANGQPDQRLSEAVAAGEWR